MIEIGDLRQVYTPNGNQDHFVGRLYIISIIFVLITVRLGEEKRVFLMLIWS